MSFITFVMLWNHHLYQDTFIILKGLGISQAVCSCGFNFEGGMTSSHLLECQCWGSENSVDTIVLTVLSSCLRVSHSTAHVFGEVVHITTIPVQCVL